MHIEQASESMVRNMSAHTQSSAVPTPFILAFSALPKNSLYRRDGQLKDR